MVASGLRQIDGKIRKWEKARLGLRRVELLRK
jgi:hypothetical protein